MQEEEEEEDELSRQSAIKSKSPPKNNTNNSAAPSAEAPGADELDQVTAMEVDSSCSPQDWAFFKSTRNVSFSWAVFGRCCLFFL